MDTQHNPLLVKALEEVRLQRERVVALVEEKKTLYSKSHSGKRKHSIFTKKKIFVLLGVGVILLGTWLMLGRSLYDPKIGKVTERTRTSTKTYLGKNEKGEYKYGIDVSLGAQNYQDEKGEWHEYDTQLVDSKKDSYDYQLKSSDHQAYFSRSIASEHGVVRVEKDGAWLTLSPGILQYTNENG